MFRDLLLQTLNETTHLSLWFFSPELALSVGIIWLLLMRLCGADRWLPPHWTAMWTALIAFLLSGATLWFAQSHRFPVEYFGGLMVCDPFGGGRARRIDAVFAVRHLLDRAFWYARS